MFAYAWLRNVVAATIAAAPLGIPAFAQDGTARIVATEGAPAFAILRASLAEIGGGSENRVQGTAAGQALRLFCDGQANVAGASAPIRASEMERCQANGIQFTEVPLGYDGQSNPILLYVRTDRIDQSTSAFLTRTLSRARTLTFETGNTPLPPVAYEVGQFRLNNHVSGSFVSTRGGPYDLLGEPICPGDPRCPRLRQ